MVRIWASEKGKRQSKLRYHVHWKMSFLLSNRRLEKCEAILLKGQHSTPKYKGSLYACFLYLSLYLDGVTVCHSRLLLLEYGSFSFSVSYPSIFTSFLMINQQVVFQQKFINCVWWASIKPSSKNLFSSHSIHSRGSGW